MQLSLDELFTSSDSVAREKQGAVFTRAWVVELILDLVSYVETEDLATKVAVEPAAGDGAFLASMARRLVRSCRRFGRSIDEATASLQAYELDHASAREARTAVIGALTNENITRAVAERMADGWVRTGDYLLTWTQASAADFVLGNPPYIRLEDVPDEISALYRKRYRTMIGRADVYVAFFEAALRHLKVGGVCGFICADRWMLNHYGTELRRLVANSFSVEAVIEMHQADAFHSSVNAYPAVTVIRRARQGTAIVASADERAGVSHTRGLAQALRDSADGLASGPPLTGFRATRVDEWFSGSDPWPCVSPERLALLKNLESRFQPLESSADDTRVGIGVATGADGIFITTDATIVEPSRLVPLAMASDTRGGSLQWSGHYLIDPWESDGRLVNLERYPRLREHFETHQNVLKRRHIANKRPHSWYRTIDHVHHWLVPKAKLYLPDIKGVIHPVLDTGETYPHHNLYFVQSGVWDIEILGGILLSSVAQFFVECYAVRMRGGWLRFQAQYLRRIRVPNVHDISMSQSKALRLAFQTRDIGLADRTVFGLYGIDGIPPEDERGS